MDQRVVQNKHFMLTGFFYYILRGGALCWISTFVSSSQLCLSTRDVHHLVNRKKMSNVQPVLLNCKQPKKCSKCYRVLCFLLCLPLLSPHISLVSTCNRTCWHEHICITSSFIGLMLVLSEEEKGPQVLKPPYKTGATSCAICFLALRPREVEQFPQTSTSVLRLTDLCLWGFLNWTTRFSHLLLLRPSFSNYWERLSGYLNVQLASLPCGSFSCILFPSHILTFTIWQVNHTPRVKANTPQLLSCCTIKSNSINLKQIRRALIFTDSKINWITALIQPPPKSFQGSL